MMRKIISFLPKSETKRTFLLLWVCVIFTLISPFLFTRSIGWISFENSGQIGDTIGGITSPIVGLLGAYLVYKALIAQIAANEELRRQFDAQQRNTIAQLQLQHKSNTLLEKQITQQTIDSEEQTRFVLIQNFEQVFFQMLNFHHDLIHKIDVDLNPTMVSFYGYYSDIRKNIIYAKYGNNFNSKFTSYNFFKVTSELLLDLISIQQKDLIVDHSVIGFERVLHEGNLHQISYKKTYMLLYKQLELDLSLYFKNIEMILESIDSQKLYPLNKRNKEHEIKKYHSSILRARLTEHEVIWLYFHALNVKGSNLKGLIEKYGMLEILDDSEKSIFKIMRNLYKDSAFKK